MIIDIDYDNTYSADPEGWKQVIKLMQEQERGHQFVCVTGRSNQGEFGQQVIQAIKHLSSNHVFQPLPFSKILRQIQRESIHWIDDSPQYVAKQDIPFSQFK